MAYSKSFFGMRRGSTKSHTYSVLKGQQVTKDRVTDISNPRTRAQMRQRAIFAEAVKFYKHANQALFKFAFEDKTQTESDYNAFIRHNVARSIVLVRDKVNDVNFPAIGNDWMLTAGSMPEPIVDWTTGIRQDSRLACESITGEETTVGQVAAKLIPTYRLVAGDILTHVHVRTNVSDIHNVPIVPPRWNIHQVFLNPDDTTLLEEVGLSVSEGYLVGGGAIGEAAGAAFIFSRVMADSSVRVSNSYLVNNTQAARIVEQAHDADYIEQALISWGAQEDAILKGALAKKAVPTIGAISLQYNPIELTGGAGKSVSDFMESVSNNPSAYNGAKITTSEGVFYGNAVEEAGARRVVFGTPQRGILFVFDIWDVYMDDQIACVGFTGKVDINLESLVLSDGREFYFEAGN